MQLGKGLDLRWPVPGGPLSPLRNREQERLLERAPGLPAPPRGRESAEGGGEEERPGLSGRDLPGLESARSARAQTHREGVPFHWPGVRRARERSAAPSLPGVGERGQREGKGGRPEAAVDATLALAYVLPGPEPRGRAALSRGQPRGSAARGEERRSPAVAYLSGPGVGDVASGERQVALDVCTALGVRNDHGVRQDPAAARPRPGHPRGSEAGGRAQ